MSAERVYEVPIHVTIGGYLLVKAGSKDEALAIAREQPMADDPRVISRVNDAGGFPTVGAGPLAAVKRAGEGI